MREQGSPPFLGPLVLSYAVLSTPWRALQQHFAEALSLFLVTEARQQLWGSLLYIVDLSLQRGRVE